MTAVSQPNEPKPESTPESTPPQSEQEEQKSGGLLQSKFFWGLIAGSTTSTLMNRALQKNEGTTTVLDPLQALQGGHDQFLRSEEIETALESGEVSSELQEISAHDSETSVYVFKDAHDPSDLTLFKSSWTPEERADFIENLQSHGADVEVSLTIGQPQVAHHKPISNEIISAGSWITSAALIGFSLFHACKALAKGMLGPGEEARTPSATGFRSLLERPEASFQNYGGNFKAVAEMKALAHDIKAVMRGELPPEKLESGFILEGPTGTGKSLLARTTASEADSPTLIINAGQLFSSAMQGGYTSTVHSFFATLRKIVADETERLRSQPGANGNEHGVIIVVLERSMLLRRNALLMVM